MADADPVLKVFLDKLARLQRSITKEQKESETFRTQQIPESVTELTNLILRCKDVSGPARELLSRYDGHLQQLEESAVKQKTPADVIDPEIDRLTDFSLDSLRWIMKVENLAEQCQSLKIELNGDAAAMSRYGSVAVLDDQLSQDQNQRASTPDPNRSANLNTSQSSASASTGAAKLPKLELMKFDGDTASWRSFWDTFCSSIHDNDCLRPVDKMKYLQSLLSGDAKKVIAGLSLSNEKYESAVALLKDQFDNPSTQIAAIHANLMQLKPVPNETKKLRSFYLEVESNLRSLECLDQDTDNPHFVSLILTKLPTALIALLERSKGPRSPWSVQQLRDALNTEIYVRETTDRYRSKPEAEKEPACNGSEDKKPIKPPPLTGFSLPAHENPRSRSVDRQPPPKPKCLFCEKDHWSDECAEFKTVNARKAQIKGRCFVCLSDRHRQKDCPSRKSCYHCQEVGRHHRSLCIRKFPVGERDPNRNPTPAHFASDTDPHAQSQFSSPNRPGPGTSGSSYPSPGPSGSSYPSPGSSGSSYPNPGPSGSSYPNPGPHGSSHPSHGPPGSSYPTSADFSSLAVGERVLMQTAVCYVVNPKTGKSVKVRLLFDGGSSRTFSLESVAKELGLEVLPGDTLHVNRFADSKTLTVPTKRADLGVVLSDNTVKHISVNILPQISGNLSNGHIPSHILNSLPQGVNLAESPQDSGINSPIDLLVGNDYYMDFFTGGRMILGNGLYLLESLVGWVISGRVSDGPPQTASAGFSMLAISQPSFEPSDPSLMFPENAVLKASWEDMCKLETIGIHDDPSITDDDLAVQQFDASIREVDGRYSVSWPRKGNMSELPSNYGLSVCRLKSLMKRLQDRPQLLEKYQTILDEQIQKGIVEIAEPPTDNRQVHYLPHHPVETPLKTTTKVRIVYDASARINRRSLSLNDCLLRGPIILQNLVVLLVRFRRCEIAITADIEKAFLQVGLHEEDRDLTRFLWPKDHKKSCSSDNLHEYRFARVPFGMTSSPFLLSATVKHHLEQESDNFPTAALMKDNMYVDNVVIGASSPAEAKRIYSEGKAVFQKAAMNLREWITSNAAVNESIPSADRVISKTSKLLGLSWNSEKDCLTVPVPELLGDGPVTKRSVLSFVAAVFDPLGYFAPVTVSGRIFFQSLCKQQISWDAEIGDDQRSAWTLICEQIAGIPQISLTRFIGNPKSAQRVILACFADASVKCYATVLYLVIKDADGRWDSNILFSRSRMNPLKPLTMPRLELMATLIGARAIKFMQSKIPLVAETVIWTDSMCVLNWIKSKKLLKSFVHRRVQEIKSVEATVRFVKTTNNPADIPIRAAGEISEMWLKGPEWLRTDTWPDWNIPEALPDVKDDIENEFLKFQKAEESFPCADASPSSPFGMKSKDFSSLSKLLRVTAWCVRFIRRLQKQVQSCPKWITVPELKHAAWLWEKQVQEEAFPDLLLALKGGDEHPMIKQVGAKLDSDSVIRCHGRLLHSELDFDAKFPVLLPKQRWFTTLVIRHHHTLVLHSRIRQTLISIRSKYWIVQGRREVRSVVADCSVCRRWDSGPYKLPNMPDLPFFRVTKNRPFSNVGLDYFGPLLIKVDNGTQKVWGCLFTCLTVRAVHLELVSDMTSEQFLLALRRFLSRRDVPSMILSDNAPQFKQVEKILNTPAVREYLSGRGIDWSYIPPYAPWMGGVYERMIQTVKKCLRKALGRTLLSHQQLEALLFEVEYVVNSRPITYDDQSSVTESALTPNHFLGLRPPPVTVKPRGKDDRDDTSSRDSLLALWKRSANCLDQFWKLFKTEYLQFLREKSRWFHRDSRLALQSQPKVGDVVLIKADLMPRGAWQIGKISGLPMGADGKIRTAMVSLPNKTEIRRSIALLYPLELSDRDT